jgi:hypothetical protein
MQIDDFMNLFNKRMFVSALLQVTKLIENTGGTSKPGESRKGSKEVSRVSSASQLTREEKKREELVRKDYLKEIPLVLKINQFER